MNMVWILVAVVWIGLAIGVGNLAAEKGRNRLAWIIFSILLCPLVTLVIVAPLEHANVVHTSNTFVVCPYCGGRVPADRDFCPHCRCFDVKSPYLKPGKLS